MSNQLGDAGNAVPSRSLRKAHLKAWWQPILDMRIDDPQQEAPYWVGTNNVVLLLRTLAITSKTAGLLVRASEAWPQHVYECVYRFNDPLSPFLFGFEPIL